MTDNKIAKITELNDDGDEYEMGREVEPQINYAMTEEEEAAVDSIVETHRNPEVMIEKVNSNRESYSGQDKGTQFLVVADDYSKNAEQTDSYACIRQMVHTLIHLNAAADRTKVYAWLAKIDACDDEKIQSQYIKSLRDTLLSTDARSLRAEPFCRLPSQGPLKALNKALEPTLLAGLTSIRPTVSESSADRPPRPTATRDSFYHRQPVPEEGTYCFAAAFSNIETE